MIIIRSIIFNLGMWIFTIPFTLFSLLTFPLKPQQRYQFISNWAKLMLRWLKICCHIDYELIGIENIPKKPCVVFCNHQSAWETLALQQILPPQVWVLKRELLWLPFFGWGLALTSPIAIDRSSGKKALLQMHKQGVDRIKKGFFIIIFPEGTRVKVNDNKKYHIGGAWLAKNLRSNILPISHNAGFFWGRNSFLKYPGKITIKIGKPFNIKNMGIEEINQEIKQWIDENVKKISE